MSKRPIYYRTHGPLEITVHRDSESVSNDGREFRIRLVKRKETPKSTTRFSVADLNGIQLLIRDVQQIFGPVETMTEEDHAELDKYCL